ncbi:hypothetical protein BRADI_4g07070v3 [Brachypodium distachyon]|uniref:Uncharacterized protein n=1 Tax=Brachypodium distachyon TaxID=15368 RepID=A0A0Q3EJU2_BRADI|nr:hypothetical protein BRADI_4g07070v3 [Brachypodium distachyon]
MSVGGPYVVAGPTAEEDLETEEQTNMANATARLFLLAALLYHSSTGNAQPSSCGKSNISVTVTPTENYFRGQREYVATITTSCACPLKDVRVWCGGVEDSVVPLDGSVVEVDEGMCVLKRPVARGSPVVFKYSSALPVNFRVFNAAPAC